MGALFRIRDEKEFYESLYELGYKFDNADYAAAKAVGANIFQSVTSELPPQSVVEPIADVTGSRMKDSFLEREFKQILGDITTKIQHNNPGKDLERFLAAVFRNVPGVTEVKENGFGWCGDDDADLIIKYTSERIKSFDSKEEIWVVQVKSYVGEHWDTNAVSQLKNAIEVFDADVGIIITTGERTQALETAFEKLFDEVSKKNVSINLIAGVEVAQFVLRYGLDLLI